MNILHLASSNRWTGAAAPALAEVEALRRYGVNAHFAYVGGYRLEQKLAAVSWALPLIERNQNPVAMRRSISTLSTFISANGIDAVHAHLTYDHLLAVLLRTRHASLSVVRTFHSGRTLRRDPFTRFLLRRTTAVCVINETFSMHPSLAGHQPLFTPPAIDHEIFRPHSRSARDRLATGSGVPLLGVIGKIAPGRGFEEAITAFSIVRRSTPEARLVVIGHGPHQPVLERLARNLAVDSWLVWAGYHESDFADYLRALDLTLFTRPGSDEGHRAVSEAMACGIPVVCHPLPGVRALLGSLAPRLIAAESTPAALAATALGVLGSSDAALSNQCVSATAINRYETAAQRLISVYEGRAGLSQ